MTKKQLHETAAFLKHEADKNGFAAALSQCEKSTVNIPLSASLMRANIDELSLSVRSRNGLMRAGLDTVGKVVSAIMSEKGLNSIRNLGRISIGEIKLAILSEAYSKLSPSAQEAFWVDYISED